MAGIAGCLGRNPDRFDVPAVFQALSFTQEERMEAVKGEHFQGVVVSPHGEAMQCHVLEDKDGLSVLLDGYITQIDGKNLASSDLDGIPERIARLYRKEGPYFAATLNGSFSIVLYDQAEGSLVLIADRLSSRSLKYLTSDQVVAFSSRLEAFHHLGFNPTRKLNQEGLAEFLVFGRLLNARIWDEVTDVPPATACIIRNGKIARLEYWKIRFRYGQCCDELEGRAEELAETLRQATERNLLGFGKASLMLSGGADSRILIACLPKDTVCYTSCDRYNFETRIARKVARASGCPHYLLKRSPTHYLDILPTAARIVEGSKEFHHAHFINLVSGMVGAANGAVFHGYGLDFILRGHYLPTKTINLGRHDILTNIPLRCKSMSEVEASLLRMEGIRLDAVNMLFGKHKDDCADIPRQLVRRFLDKVEGSVVEPVDAIELFVFGNLSAWLTFPMSDSLRHYFPERLVAVDNALVDIALSTSPEMRFNSKLFLKAFYKLDRRLCLIPHSYTFLPLCMGNLSNMTHRIPTLVYDHAYVPLAMRTHDRGVPRWTLTPGPWPSHGYFWREGPISEYLKELLSDDSAMRDEAIDRSVVLSMLEAHKKGRSNNVLPLARVITFLAWRKTCP